MLLLYIKRDEKVMEPKKSPLELLEDYLDNQSDISLEDAGQALKIVYNGKSDNKYRLYQKIINLIYKRIDESLQFAKILSSKQYSDEEKQSLALDNLPFKDGNIDVEKKIIAAAYQETESKSYENLIIGFLCEDRDNYDEEDEEIVIGFIRDNNITFDTIREIEQKEKDKAKARKRDNK